MKQPCTLHCFHFIIFTQSVAKGLILPVILRDSPTRSCRPLAMAPGHPNIVTSEDEAIQIARQSRTVAVLGCKTQAQAGQPAYFVPEFLQATGMDVIPIPVFYPEVTEILGKPVVRDLKAIKRPVDILDVFRRPADLPGHLDDILGMDPRPACVWLQSSNPEFEQRLAEEGIRVVVGRCLKVDRAAAGHRAKF